MSAVAHPLPVMPLWMIGGRKILEERKKEGRKEGREELEEKKEGRKRGSVERILI
jgi:hypothetical protein